MIWLILMLTWAVVIAGTHFFIGQDGQQGNHWKRLAAISLVVSLWLYYCLGYPNLPDHPYGEMVELLKDKRF